MSSDMTPSPDCRAHPSSESRDDVPRRSTPAARAAEEGVAVGAGVPRMGAHARTCAHLVALAALVGPPDPSREQSASCVIASGAEKFAERLLLLLLAPAPTRALEAGTSAPRAAQA